MRRKVYACRYKERPTRNDLSSRMTPSFDSFTEGDPWKKAFDDDGGYPKWAPSFLRLSKDARKLKKLFNQQDLMDIEYFAHYTQMTVLLIAFVWSVTWCCCWQLSDYRRERKRQALMREALKGQ